MSILDTIRDVLRGAKRLQSEDLARSAADLESQIPGMRSTIEEIERRRAGVLIEGTDAQLQKVEEELAAARRNLDRGEALFAELKRRESEAKEAETAAALAAERASIEAEVQAIVKQRLGDRRKLEDQLRAMVLREFESNERVRAFNDRLQHNNPIYGGDGKRADEVWIKTAAELIPEETTPVFPQFRVVWPTFY